MTRGFRTTMLPKISEEKKAEDEKIQDFCESMKIENSNESKKKLDVRSIYDVENETRQSKDVKLGRNRTVSAKPKSSLNSNRERLGFSRSHVFSARASRKSIDRSPIEIEEMIDLTSMDDAQKLKQRFYQNLGLSSDGTWSKDIESHLLKFEDADLSFPKLWNKEELFERANNYAIETQVFLGEKSSFTAGTMPKEASRPQGKENRSVRVVQDKNARTHPKEMRQMTKGFDQIFYSKPVCLGSINNTKSKLITSHLTKRSNRLPSLNTRALPPQYGSTSWLETGRIG